MEDYRWFEKLRTLDRRFRDRQDEALGREVDRIVLDGDRHGGPDGVSAAEQLFAERSLNTATIPTVITPQDGRHYWFMQPTEGNPLGNSDKAIRDKAINVRGAGGYVIAPGTRLPDGRQYKRDPNTPSTIEAVQNGTVPVLPPTIETLLRVDAV